MLPDPEQVGRTIVFGGVGILLLVAGAFWFGSWWAEKAVAKGIARDRIARAQSQPSTTGEG